MFGGGNTNKIMNINQTYTASNISTGNGNNTRGAEDYSDRELLIYSKDKQAWISDICL